jgi:hypothetical protein
VIACSSRIRRIQTEERLRLDRIHAGIRLVEEEDPRGRRDRSRDFEPTLIAVRQVPRETIPMRARGPNNAELDGATRQVQFPARKARLGAASR